jgi:hypothetical protein
MESQIELIYEDIRGKDKAKLIKFVGDLDATNVETVLKKSVVFSMKASTQLSLISRNFAM